MYESQVAKQGFCENIYKCAQPSPIEIDNLAKLNQKTPNKYLTKIKSK